MHPRSLRSRCALFLSLAVLTPAWAGCGVGGYVNADAYVGVGTVVAENDTFTAPSTLMLDFALWPTYGPASSTNLLPYELFPGEAVAVADVYEDTYDADALMSDGFIDYLEVWDGVFVPGDEVTTFFAF